MLKPTILTILLLFLLSTFNGPVAFYLRFVVIFIYGATYGQKTASRVVITKRQGEPDEIHLMNKEQEEKLNFGVQQRREFKRYLQERQKAEEELEKIKSEIKNQKEERGNY